MNNKCFVVDFYHESNLRQIRRVPVQACSVDEVFTVFRIVYPTRIVVAIYERVWANETV